MSTRVIPRALRPSFVRITSLSVALLSFLGAETASGQEDPVDSAASEPPAFEPASDDTGQEAEGPSSPSPELEEAEAPEGSDAPAADEESVVSSEGNPAEETMGEPEPTETDVLDPMDEGAEEEAPDYFGSYEPLAPTMRLDPEYDPNPPYQGPFRAGRLSVGPSIGGVTIGDETYFILGANVGYFLVNGLQVHLDVDFWLIGDPTIIAPSPGLRYVFYMVPKVHPYVGGFYRRYIPTGGVEGVDSVGGRGGVYFDTGPSSYFGIGVYYERLLQDSLFGVDAFYGPEVAFGFAF